MDELVIYCDLNKVDKLTLSGHEDGLHVETFTVSRDSEPYIKLNVDTAIELRDALNKWIGEQQ